MHRLALIPKLLLRKRNDAPFRVAAEDIEEERSRNGIKRVLEREKRRQKEQKEKSHVHAHAHAHGHGREGGQTGRQANNHNNHHHKQNYALLHAADDSSGWEDTDDDDFYVPAVCFQDFFKIF